MGLLGFLLIKLIKLIQYFFPSTLKIEHVKLKVSSLKNNYSKLRIVHLSDFHNDLAGKIERVTHSLLENVVRETNKARPDFIFLTGDYVQLDPHAIHELTDVCLSRIHAKYGIYAILGNHDYKTPDARDIIIKALQDINIKVLVSEYVIPIPGDDTLEIIGLCDHSFDYKLEEAFKHVNINNENNTRIVLTHNPDTVYHYKDWKVDLIVAGHTHGGQICLPYTKKPVLGYFRILFDLLPAFIRRLVPRKIKGWLYVLKDWNWASGLHTSKRTDGGLNNLYVSRGLATHPPLRLNCPPELTIIDLIPENLKRKDIN